MPVELGSQGGDQVADLGIDRAHAAEMVVMLGDLQEPLTRDIPAPRHVFQERHHVFPALGTAETDDQDRIIDGMTDFRRLRLRKPRSRSLELP